jgi:ribosomal-protein-alanine N-acetyltransferase
MLSTTHFPALIIMPEIEIARLKLRPFTADDLNDYYRQMTSDFEVMRTLLLGRTLTLAETEPRLRLFMEHWGHYQFGVWVLRDKENGELIGQCGLRWCYEYTPEIELVYAIAKSYWGKGIATEAAKAAVRYGFEELKPDYIMALTAPTNLASQRVMQKVGMKYEKDARYYEKDCAYYTISRQEWQADESLYILRET